LFQVEDGKKLGEWSGLCKIDKEGNARKVVRASCVVVKDWGDDSSPAIDVLQNYFKTA
jgi:small subunit ribosomal protein S12e